MNITTSDILSVIAVVISGLSLVVSLVALYKDKGVVRAWCQLVFNRGKALEGDPELHVYAANAGKRPVILNYLSMKTRNGYVKRLLKPISPITNDQGEIIDIPDVLAHEIGIKLEESQTHHVIFGSDDWGDFYDGEDDFSRDIYFEDSLGKKHKVRNSRKVIGKYLDLVVNKSKDVPPGEDAPSIEGTPQ